MSLSHPFSWPQNMVPPRDAREILTPFKGSNEKVMTDVIPTISITDSYPVVDSTTFSALTFNPAPKADGNPIAFGTYILRKMEPDQRKGWTKCWFSRAIPSDPLPAPYKTESEQIDHLWHDQLLRVDFLPDYSFPHTTRGPGGVEIYAPRYYPRVFHIPEATEGTLAIHRFYIASVPFVVKQTECPQPSDVNFNILGVEGQWSRCLHPKLVFDSKKTAIVAYNAATTSVVQTGGAIAGQLYEETNFEDWTTYDWIIKQRDVMSSLYELEIISVTPPTPSDVIITTA